MKQGAPNYYDPSASSQMQRAQQLGQAGVPGKDTPDVSWESFKLGKRKRGVGPPPPMPLMPPVIAPQQPQLQSPYDMLMAQIMSGTGGRY